MKYIIPVVWSLKGTMSIEADSMEEAIAKSEDTPLPTGKYIDESFKVIFGGITIA